MTYSITDASGQTASDTIVIGVVAPPAFGAHGEVSFTAGAASGRILDAATGGAPFLVYSLSDPSAANLAFTPKTRRLSSSTAIAIGEWTFTLTATDRNGGIGTVAVPVVAVAAPQFTQASLVRGFGTQSPTDYTLPSASGGVAPIAYSIGGTLPNGLMHDATANRLHGTATTLQSVTATLIAVDSNGARATLPLVLDVVAAPSFPVIDAVTFTVGAQSTVELPQASGVGVLTYTLDGAPAWLAVTPAPPNVMPLTLTATPSSSDADVTVTYQATDETGQTADLEVEILVVAAPNFAAAQPERTFTAGAVNSFQLINANDGAGALTYSLPASGETLAGGLMFDAASRELRSTNAIAAGESTYTLTATDANGASDTVSVPILVVAAPAFAVNTLNRAFGHNTASDYDLPRVSGGVAPISYALVGVLPSGLTYGPTANKIGGTAATLGQETSATLTATDANSATATLALSFTIIDAPQFDSSEAITFTIGTAKTAPLPSAGGAGVITYSIDGATPNWVSVTPDASSPSLTPFTFVATASSSDASATVSYQATDETGQTTTLQLGIVVVVAPNFAAQAELSFTAGTESTFTLNAASGGAGDLVYSLSNTSAANLTFDAASRALRSGTSIVETVSTNYTLTATDRNGASGTVSVPVIILAAPTFADASLSRAFGHNAATDYTLPSASDGVAPLAYSVSGNLPAGLAHDAANNRITGTATNLSQSTTATLTATDANGATATLTLNFRIVGAPQFAASDDITFTVGAAKTVVLPIASGAGGVTYVFISTPASWVSVTPDVNSASLVPFTFSATAMSGDSDTSVAYQAIDETGQGTVLNINILAVDAPNFAAQPERSFTAGTASTFVLNAANDGAGVLTYSLPASGETLSAGLTFDAATRALRSTTSIVETASASYTLTATDANGASGTVDVPVIILAAPAFDTASLSRAFGHNAVTSYDLPSVTGGVAPIVYSISGGTLPGGLSHDAANNRISGRATTLSQSTTATLTATDANGATATLTLNFNIVDAPQFSSSEPITFTIGTAKTVALPSASGAGVITYSIDGAPSWATVTPDASASSLVPFTFVATASSSDSGVTVTYTATDVTGQSTIINLAIVVVAAPNFAAQDALSFTAGTASAFAVNAAGDGAGDLIYALPASGETLSNGLMFDAASREVRSSTSIVETALTNYTLTATDTNGASGTVQVPIVIVAAPAFADNALTRAFGHNTQTNFDLPSVTGGVAPIVYSISGNLPGGLSHDAANNRITGTASTLSQSTTAILTATDANGATATLTLNFTIVDAPQFASSEAITFTIATAKTVALPSASGAGVITYALDGAPSWASVTPDASASSLVPFTFSATASSSDSGVTVTYSATDDTGQTTTLNLDIVVVVAPNFAAHAEVSFTAGTASVFMLDAANNGAGVLTYVLSTTPTALIFNASTRELRSTTSIAATASTNYTLTATDANGASGTVSVSVIILAAPAFANASLSRAFGHQTQTNFGLPSVSGGVAPITYAVSGTLPDGLSHDAATNRITGTATNLSQSTTATLTATDANGASATLSLAFNIVAAPRFASSEAITFTRDTQKTIALPSASGAGVVTYGIDGAPSWALVTPDASAPSLTPFTFTATAGDGDNGITVTYTATDETGQTTTLLLEVIVVGALNFAAQTELSFTAGTASTFTVNPALAGAGMVAYALPATGETLSTGLTFDAASRELRSNTAIVATASTNYTLSATDANGATATTPVPVVIVAAPNFASASLSRAFGHESATNYNLPSASDGVAPIGYSLSGNLPNGLVYEAANNRITGTASTLSQTTTATLTATDANGATANLTLNFEVVAAPKFASADDITFTVGASKTAPLPTAGGVGTVTYTLQGAPMWVTVTPDDSAPSLVPFTFSATATASDADAIVSYTASDDSGQDTLVEINVLVVAAPNFAAQAELSYTAGAASAYTLITANDGAGALTYSLSDTSSANLVFDAATRELRSTASIAAGESTYTLTATDANGVAGTVAVPVIVVAAPAFATDLLSRAFGHNTVIAYDLPRASEGVAPIVYTLSNGRRALPTGLSFDAANNRIVGTPTRNNQTTAPTLTATDANGATASIQLMVTVVAAPMFVASDDITFTIGTPKTAVLPLAGGTGMVTYRFLNSPPGWVDVTPSTSAPSTAPYTFKATAVSANANASVTYAATDESDQTTTLPINLVVIAAPNFTAAQTELSFTAGTVSDFAVVTAVDGAGDLMYSLSGAPSGLLFDAATHRLRSTTAIAAAGSTNYTLTATDANGATGTVQVPVIVVAAPAFASATLSRGFGNQGATDYTLPSVSGGVAPIVYAHSGTLPSGLNYDADANRITGTATTLGQLTNTTLTATDANGASASLALSFEIVAAPRFAAADDITFTIGTQKIAPLPIATGVGVVTYTIDGAPGWAAVTPSPPSVMPLTLTATASASDSGAIVTYSATDESEQTTPLLLTVVVVAAPNFTVAQTELSFTAGTASNYALVGATAGAGDLIYSLSATPSGLTFDAATRRLHSTASIAETASTNYTLTATDANGASGTVQVPVVVIAAPAFAADAVDDRAFGHQSATNYNLPNVTGGVAPINYSISGNLPRGLAYDAANNRITGSATRRSEVRMVTLTAVDTNGASAALMLTFRIVDAPRFASADDITFTIGTPKTAVLPSAAGDGVVTYALQGAPAWLAVTPSTATALVPFTFIATATGGNSGAVVTYTATDESEQATTLEINIIVVVAPNFAAQDELSFTAGTANAFTLNAGKRRRRCVNLFVIDHAGDINL